MKLTSFCLLTALAFLYAGLTVAETMTYHKWEDAILEQKYLQSRLAFFQHVNAVLNQLVRRMAVDSQHDPALAQLLKDNRIKVVVQDPTPPPTDTSTGFGVPPPNPGAPSPDKPTQPSTDANAIHP